MIEDLASILFNYFSKKVKGHASWQNVEDSVITVEDYKGNSEADLLAVAGACAAYLEGRQSMYCSTTCENSL